MIIHCDCSNRFEFRPCFIGDFQCMKYREVSHILPRGMAQIISCISKEGVKKLGWWQWTLQSAFWFSTGPKKTPPHLTDMFSKKKHVEKNMRMASTSVTWKNRVQQISTPTPPVEAGHLVLVLLEITPHLLHPRRLLRFSNTAMTRWPKICRRRLGGGEVLEDSEATPLAWLHPTCSWVL